MDTTPEEAAQLVALLLNGLWQYQVAARLKISRFRVRRVLLRFLETGGYIRRPGSGRRRCTTATDDRYIVSGSLQNRFLTAAELQILLRAARRTAVSISTIRRRLREKKLLPRRAATGPQWKPQHRIARRQ
ncbi:uncharacterized protein LOC133529562 [Cydia pomonella]|uniref:uncharacterized protein LOC133529562 n=1 Tax=Cydia pomonella TaxID=82600 RepID=UPI002ADD68EB|nr:uncharacterized protein LOC133529562 [Cydia pomonella]